MEEAETHVTGASPRRLRDFVYRRLHLCSYLKAPGDGRVHPQIPAEDLLWSMLVGQHLRECSFHGVESLVQSTGRSALEVSRSFGDDALAYFTDRLDPLPLRRAISAVLHLAKRNKTFDGCFMVGLAIDGSGMGRRRLDPCTLCHPVKKDLGEVLTHQHHLCMASIVGAGLSLPFDVEPYGPGDSEYGAGQRLVRRAVANVGPRFFDYVTADAKFATAPFLNEVTKSGLNAVVRLKVNLPELFAAAKARFEAKPPDFTFEEGRDKVEVWDAADFDPWGDLFWKTVRVLRYCQHKPDGAVVEAYWLTNFPPARVGSVALFRIAKTRWEIENQGFNDGKNRNGMEHIKHHTPNSMLVCWLLTVLGMTIERLWRLRYLHRGSHPVLTAIALVRALRQTLGRPATSDTS